MSRIERLGVLTGGGDAPGLNAVIRAVVRTAERIYGIETVGVLDGFAGLLDHRFRQLYSADVRDLIGVGGTILGTTNRVNPFKVPDGEGGYIDRSGDVAATVEEEGFDTLIVIGGDGTLKIGRDLTELGVRVVGVPKTIDNDLAATDYTFGFWTAIGAATDALDRLQDTAESHHRVMVLELMGRDAGWIALHAGVAGAADVILIPEIPYRPRAVAAKIEERRRRGQAFSLVVVAEGARGMDGEQTIKEIDEVTGYPRLGGAGETLKRELTELVDHEIRVTVLGHLQRGGSPVPFDRILATQLGQQAVHVAAAGKSSRMVCLVDGDIKDVPLAEAVAVNRGVDPEHQLVAAARSTGIGFGDEE